MCKGPRKQVLLLVKFMEMRARRSAQISICIWSSVGVTGIRNKQNESWQNIDIYIYYKAKRSNKRNSESQLDP